MGMVRPVMSQSLRGLKQALPSIRFHPKFAFGIGEGVYDVDFFAMALPYVADPQVVGFGIE